MDAIRRTGPTPKFVVPHFPVSHHPPTQLGRLARLQCVYHCHRAPNLRYMVGPLLVQFADIAPRDEDAVVFSQLNRDAQQAVLVSESLVRVGSGTALRKPSKEKRLPKRPGGQELVGLCEKNSPFANLVTRPSQFPPLPPLPLISRGTPPPLEILGAERPVVCDHDSFRRHCGTVTDP